MLGYVTIGTSNFDGALKFYDALVTAIGGNRAFPSPTGQFYAFSQGSLFGVLKPHNGQPASGGNGSMLAFKVASPKDVDRVYDVAIRAGAVDDGKPGPRGERGFYGSYFKDADGNKVCVYHM